MKRLYIILIAAFIVFAAFWGLYKFSGVFTPKMTLSVLQINRVGADEATLQVRVDLKNRSPLSVSFKDVNFRIKANAETLVETDTVIPVDMKAFKTTSFTVPITLKLSEIKALNYQKTLEKQDSCMYSFMLEVVNEPGFFLPDTLFIEKEEKLPLYHLPEVELANMEAVELLGSEGPRYNLTLLIKNKNKIPLVIKNPRYAVTFEGKDVLIEGTYPEDLVVKEASSKTFNLMVQMDRETIIKHASKLIFRKEELDVNLIFKGNLETNSTYIDGCNLVVKVKGNLKELMKN
ncbi:LEA type 2 family protein [uncultured Arcticibacterium sp.]|uniref:LEA type 2 family protein n=1 Tax=uncultured Arcticibacterium sp. TaxID=2173042 RepID=UPI0030FD0BFD